MIALYFVVAVVGGVVCSFFASGKNRNALGWFVIGFLLPLVGVILVVVLPDNAEPSKEAPSRQPTYLDDLQKLGDLRDRGVLTPEEFEAKKRMVLERSERKLPKATPAQSDGSVPVDEPEAKELLAVAQKHHFAKEFDEARREYEALASRFPSSKQALVAHQQLANLKNA